MSCPTYSVTSKHYRYGFKLQKAHSKKLALLAVSNNFLKQSFAIAKSGLPYDEKYVSVLPK